MPSTADLRFAFNRGEIGTTALARVDREGLRLAAEFCENFMPLQQGPMQFRPGSAYLGRTRNDAEAKILPFIFSRTDTANLELTNLFMRVWVDDELVVRPNINTSIKNGTFTTPSTNVNAGWVLTATTGATASIASGLLTLTATARGSTATAKQIVVVPVASRNVEHALRITVTRGPVYFKVGSGNGLDNYIKRTALGTGTHSLAFTPGAGFVVEFENDDRAARIVTSCTLEDNQTLELPTIWRTSDFDKLQSVQSGDVVYVACDGRKQKKIERRSPRSWSIVDYNGLLGPLRVQKPREQNIALKSTAYEGNGQLKADKPFFKSNHVGTTIRCFPTGQTRQTQLAGEDTWTDALRVSGIDTERYFSVRVSGRWTGRMTLQMSLDGPDHGFKDVNADGISGSLPQQTTNGIKQYNDAGGNNNKVIWYRFGFREGDYKSGVATVEFGPYSGSYNGGPTTGGNDSTDGTGADRTGGEAAFALITNVVSATVADIEILKPFSSLDKTKDWLIGEWNEDDGYPTAVTLFDGRLWWGGKDRVWGSVSDDYENFDHDFEGDAGPISRSIGTGPVDTISWLLALSRLMVGRGMAVSSIRSSNFDEPLTPTNFTIKDATTRGVSPARPGQVDARGVYIHANGRQLFELMYRVDAQDYAAVDLTQFHTDIGLDGFTRLAVSRSPDTRIFVVREDGQLCVLLRDQDGDVQLSSWWRIKRTSGAYEDVAVLPGDIEDQVYVVVRRGSQRFIEKFARRDECIGAPITKCLDSHIVYEGSLTTTITGLDHLVGATVHVWGAQNSDNEYGEYLGDYVVKPNGSVGTLPKSVRVAVVGIKYDAIFISAKLAYGAGLAIGSLKRIDNITFVLYNTHNRALFFGQDETHLDPMPLVEEGEDVDSDQIWDQYDKKPNAVAGAWEPDARLVLKGIGPYPATVGAVMITVDTSVRQN